MKSDAVCNNVVGLGKFREQTYNRKGHEKQISSREVDYWGLINARYKRRPTLHVPKLMEMDQNNRFSTLALNSRHVKVHL